MKGRGSKDSSLFFSLITHFKRVYPLLFFIRRGGFLKDSERVFYKADWKLKWLNLDA
jgi:hypothetical protein